MKSPEVQEHLARRGGLAYRLRQARGEIRSKDLAARLEWPESKVSKILRGHQIPTESDLRQWAGATGVDAVSLDQWLAMAEEAENLHQTFRKRMRSGQVAVQVEYNKLIERADLFRFVEREWIPRPLQVVPYTRAVLSLTARKFADVDDTPEAVAMRQSCTVYLYDLSKQWELIIGEEVLRRPWCGVSIMRMQLDRLLSITDLPNVRLGIYPLDQVTSRWPAASFEVYGDVAYIENEINDDRRVHPDDLSVLHAGMNELWPDCREGDAAREVIRKAMSALPRE